MSHKTHLCPRAQHLSYQSGVCHLFIFPTVSIRQLLLTCCLTCCCRHCLQYETYSNWAWSCKKGAGFGQSSLSVRQWPASLPQRSGLIGRGMNRHIDNRIDNILAVTWNSLYGFGEPVLATYLWHWWSVCGVLPKTSWLVSKHDPCSQQHAQQYGKARQAASTTAGHLKDWLNSSSHVQWSCGPHLLTLTEGVYFMNVYYSQCAIRLSQQYLRKIVHSLYSGVLISRVHCGLGLHHSIFNDASA